MSQRSRACPRPYGRRYPTGPMHQHASGPPVGPQGWALGGLDDMEGLIAELKHTLGVVRCHGESVRYAVPHRDATSEGDRS